MWPSSIRGCWRAVKGGAHAKIVACEEIQPFLIEQGGVRLNAIEELVLSNFGEEE